LVGLRARLPGLFAPADGRGSWLTRLLLAVLVAPATQLTFVNFDQQAFLFDVFHTTRLARVGHGVGMAGVNLFAMVLLAGALGPVAALAWAALLLVWYGVVAGSVRLPGWWLAAVPLVLGLCGGALGVAHLAGDAALTLGVAGLFASGGIISLSHAAEPLFPPRAGHPTLGMPLSRYLKGERPEERRPARVVARVLKTCLYPAPIGLLNEIWAAPRLLPYNLLRVMLALGYAPELRARLDDWAQRALASGQPALDFIGIGGGRFLSEE
jgi:hypothetical protein